MPRPPVPPDWPAPGAVPMGLVGGVGRSGTTVLRDVLGRHPDVLAFPEVRFSVDPDGLVDFYQSSRAGWSPLHTDVRVRRLLALCRAVARRPTLAQRALDKVPLGLTGGRRATPAYFEHAALDVCPPFLDHVDRLEAALPNLRYAGVWTGTPRGAPAEVLAGGPYDADALAALLGGFWRAVARDSLAHAGRQFFLDKETWSILWLDAILDLLPGVRLVHIVRDPRDVVASYTTMRWAPSDPLTAARLVASVLARWAEVRARVPAEAVLEIRLEDLAAEPERVLRDVCAFFGLDWSDAVLTLPLSGARSGRWRRDLPAGVQGEVAQTLAPASAAYGYDP